MTEFILPSLLLKGYVAADCYAVPDCRISSDVDIYVSEKLEAKACAFLQKRGFKVSPRWTDGHHSVCSHPDYGSFEIHAMLFDRLVADIWFRDLKSDAMNTDRNVRIEANGTSYRTLEYTDNLLFMTLHMVKHFINGGISLRMMLDIALFSRKYGAKIDFDRFWSVLRTLNYSEMVGSVLWAMILYCGFDAQEFPGIPDENIANVEMLLTDLEIGGWLGKNTPDEGRESHLVYSAYMQRKGTKYYRMSMLKRKTSNAFRRLFPARVVLMKYCPEVAEKVSLTPLAWWKHVLHGVDVIIGKNQKGTPDEKLTNEEQEFLRKRTGMLKQMDMMK